MTIGSETSRPSSLQLQAIPGSNHARLLQLLYGAPDQSRADLARAVGLTKATVSALIADLLEADLVVETRQRPVEGPGRPAVELDLARTAWQVLAIDLSPDHEFRGAVLDLTGEVLFRATVQRHGETGDAAVEQTKLLTDQLLELSDGRVLGIGICAPGIVNLEGVVLTSHNLGWEQLALQNIISDHTGLPTCIANDANASALAERDANRASANRADDDLLLVKVGRGVGAAILANGTLIHGPQFTAGEIGHVAIGEGEGPRCVCGRVGCLEATLSLPRLEEKLVSASTEERDAILDSAGARLGAALAPLIGALGLTSVVVSGPPELLDGPLLAAAREGLRPRLKPELIDALDLRLTTLGEDIALQGALILVLRNVLGIS